MNGSNGLKEVTYKDADGRLWARKIPHDAPESEAEFGIPLGPFPLDAVVLPTPEEFLVLIHNQLFYRRIFSPEDLRRRRADVAVAIASALRIDPQVIETAWNQAEPDSSKSATVEKVRRNAPSRTTSEA